MLLKDEVRGGSKNGNCLADITVMNGKLVIELGRFARVVYAIE